MRKLKTVYAYLFYFFYNSVNKVKGNIFVQFKALLMISGLEFLLIMSIVTYCIDIKKILVPKDFNKLYLLFLILPIVVLKLWFFERNKNWMRYIEKFNAWPRHKQKTWNRIMQVIVIFVFANLLFSFYLMSQIDWKQYR